MRQNQRRIMRIENDGRRHKNDLFRQIIRECIMELLHGGYNETEEELNESLIVSYDIEAVKRIFERRLGTIDGSFKIVEEKRDGYTMFSAIIKINDKERTPEIIQKIIKFMKYCGYYKERKTDIVGGYYTMYFRPYHQKDDYNIREKCRYIYHITSVNNYGRIREKGFIPNSDNAYFNYNDRLYFVLGNNLTSPKIKILDAVRKSHDWKADETVVLLVDADKIGENVKFNIDHLAVDCVFTYDNIAPEAIVGEVPFSKFLPWA